MEDKLNSLAEDKKSLEKKATARNWLVSVGIEKLSSGYGIVLTVTPGAKARAETFVKSLNLYTQVRVREMRTPKARVN